MNAVIVGLLVAQGGQVELVKNSINIILSPAFTSPVLKTIIKDNRRSAVKKFFILVILILKKNLSYLSFLFFEIK
jgi:hypothetical protein